jgi:hypothetical protein
MTSLPQNLSDLEKKLMLAMGLTSVSELDELLAGPVNQWAEDHSEPPDDEYEIYDRAIAHIEVLWEVRERFKALSEARYLS